MLIRDLGWLVALAKHEHLTDTAAILGTNQPTLSPAPWTRTPVWSGWRSSTRSPRRWCPGCCEPSTGRAPRVRVLLSQEPAHEILDDLAVGAVDLAITSTRPAEDHGWHRLQEERLVLIVPPPHRLRDRARVTLAELGGEEIVTTPVGFGDRTLVDAVGVPIKAAAARRTIGLAWRADRDLPAPADRFRAFVTGSFVT